MAVLKLSKKDIIKNGEKEEKITLKRSDLSYDSAKLYGWEQSNKESLDILNQFNERVNNQEWLSKDDLTSYKKALDSYVSTTNRLRGINKAFGKGYTDEEEASWAESLASLNKGYDEITGFYSQFDSDKVYSQWKAQKERWGVSAQNLASRTPPRMPCWRWRRCQSAPTLLNWHLISADGRMAQESIALMCLRVNRLTAAFRSLRR